MNKIFLWLRPEVKFMVAVTRKQYITLQDTKVYPHTNLLSGLRQRMLAELYCFRLVRPSVCPSVRGHSNSVILIVFFSKFHIWSVFINLSYKFKYGFCPPFDNQGDRQNGRQNGRHLYNTAIVVTLTVISNRIFSFYIWIISINLSFKFEYGFCLTSNNQDGRQNGRRLSMSAVVVTLT